ncbi:hypothetical protein LXL04_039872 [Taraxacum kok-saghyz]
MHKHPVIFTTSDSIQNGNYKPLRYPFRPHSDPHLTTSRRPISFLHRHRLLLSQNPLRRRHSLVSYLHRLTATWPSITGDPRLHDIISTFPAVHRSFFQDSFPALVITTAAGVTHHTQSHHLSSHQYPSQIISAIDLRYQKDIVYSKSNFTDTTDAFLSSELRIRLNPESKPETINLKLVGEVDEATLMSHLQESMNLNWIVIDPTHKRAGNISSIKPVNVRRGWMNDDIHLLYAIVLPGSDENNKVVQCRIQVVMGVDTGSKGLKVKEVMMELIDMDFCLLKGREFLMFPENFQHAGKPHYSDNATVFFNNPHVTHTVCDRLNHHRHQRASRVADDSLRPPHYPGGVPSRSIVPPGHRGGRRRHRFLVGQRIVATVWNSGGVHNKLLEHSVQISLFQPLFHHPDYILRRASAVDVRHKIAGGKGGDSSCNHFVTVGERKRRYFAD